MTYRSNEGRRSGANPVVLIIVVLALLAVVVFLGATLLGNGGTEATPQPSAAVSQPVASAQPSPTEAALNEDLLSRRMTVLVLGVDLNAQREAAGEPRNTDAIMLVSLSADQSQLTMLSLPRDTVDVPLGDGTTWSGKVNAIEREAGIETMAEAMQATFDTPIDAYVQLDMDDLAALVGAVGGVEIDVDKQLVDPPIGLDLQPGAQELDAETALKYVRTRQDSDYDRADRQQQLLLALVEKLSNPQTDVDVRAAIESLDSLETNLPLDDLPTLVELARRAQAADVTRQVARPPDMIVAECDSGDGRGYILQPNIEAIQAWVDEQIGV
jgi:LCP family protein required for cell wall assembly